MAKNYEYNASNIEILEGLEAVRTRPGMYIGSTDTYGLHHLLWEIIDNSVDEAMNGFGNKIQVIIHKDGSITVIDEGRGIPCDIHPQAGIPAIQLILTTLHSGGKFNANVYKASGGLHGVGSSVTNALSTFLDVTVFKEGKIFNIAFENGGKLKTPLRVLGNTNKHGTTTTFKPDGTIFKTTEFSYERIYNHLQESAFLLKGVKFILVDERDNQRAEFFYQNGIKEYLSEVGSDKKPLGDAVYFEDKIEDVEVEIAFQYFQNVYSEEIKSYVNNVRTIDGGTHVVGFRIGLARAVNEYIENNGLNKGKIKLEGGDIREGLIGIVSVRMPAESNLEFEGQTKGKLGSQYIQPIVANLIYTKFGYYLNENKDFAVDLVKKCQDAQAARIAARKASEESRSKKKSKEQVLLSDKLTPAQSKDYKLNELFIVEGDSAGGTAKKGRDPRHQAILPLRGKTLNTEGLTYEEFIKNKEIATIIDCIGAGVGNTFNIDNIRYDKVIIMTDADTDGAHIQTLLLTFFYNNMPQLIKEGHVYVALPPLYRVYKTEKGKTIKEIYCFNDDELIDAKKKIGANYAIQRYKGLGEMNDKQLKYTTMDKEHRVLLKVFINDSVLCANRINVLMGKDPSKRKVWVEQNVDFNEKDDFIKEVTNG